MATGGAAWCDEEQFNDGIVHICDALMRARLWHEIDGDGTEFTVIADHVDQLVRQHDEAIDLLRRAVRCIPGGATKCWETRRDIGAWLAEVDERRADLSASSAREDAR